MILEMTLVRLILFVNMFPLETCWKIDSYSKQATRTEWQIVS